MASLQWLSHSVCHALGYHDVTRNLGDYTKDQERACKEVKNLKVQEIKDTKKDMMSSYRNFQMPLHYPRYKKSDYEKMEEWKVDLLLKEYGLSYDGTLDEKRVYAMGAFLWPDQY